MAVTMRDVAKAAGVSPMTVSNVLNGRTTVDEGRRQRVLAAVDELGYQLNLSARHLRSGNTGTVAAIVPAFDHLYFGALATALTCELQAKDLHTVVEQSGSTKDGELLALSGARMLRYDGVILSAVGLSYEDINALRFDLPIVLLGEQAVPKRFDHIMMNNVEGARLATEHLIQTGCKRVAILGGLDGPIESGMSQARANGWRQAHIQAGLVADPELMIPMVDYDAHEARSIVQQLLTARPDVDGIFCVTDFAAIGAITGVQHMGLQCPRDVAIVGFDNLSIGEDLFPAVTTIDPGLDWIVEQASRLLLTRIAQGNDLAPEHLVSPVRLVQRETTRPMPR